MERTESITRYRERLDKTLASPQLTDKEKLKIHIKDQLNCSSSDYETREYDEALLEKRTVEVSNFLDMLRSASVNEHDAPKCPKTAHGAWKLKQDTEELRVMYREGPHGSPFHTLLAEGYVDGPLDVCLCIGWESALYRNWWPQFSFPAFKIISSKCVQKICIGEQVASVRMKVPWPLSLREAVMHYFEFKYFQDDLIIVLLSTIPDLERIGEAAECFKKDGLPEAKDVVRIDVVGGFALQKVTAERSYFRTIASLDIKMDFVPPSLINFISRQLIGSGFKLYQKVVSSSFADEDYSKALEDPLYTRIRQALYSDNKDKIPLGQKELEKETCSLSEEPSAKGVQNDFSYMDGKFQTLVEASESSLENVEVKGSRTFGEIEEERAEESTTMEHCGKDNAHIPSTKEYPANEDKKAHISEEVQQALALLEKAINMIREYGFNAQTKFFSTFSNEEPPHLEDKAGKESDVCCRSDVCTEVLKTDDAKRISQSPNETVSGNLSSSIVLHKKMGSNSCTGGTNHSKIVPAIASPEGNHLNFSANDHIDVSNFKNGMTEELQKWDNLTNYNKHEEVTGVDGDGPKGVIVKRQKKRRSCFFLSIFCG